MEKIIEQAIREVTGCDATKFAEINETAYKIAKRVVELSKWDVYEIPEGYEARIEGNKVILEMNDESIRDFLYEFIKVCGWSEKQYPPREKVLAYLEKQKEQKPVDSMQLSNDGFTPKDIFRFNLASCLYNYGKEVAAKCLDTHILNEELNEYVTMHDVNEVVEDSIELLQRNAMTQKPAEKQDYSGLNDLERAIHRGFLCAGVENVPVGILKDTAQDCLAQIKPAEWSEEDNAKKERLISIVKRALHENKCPILNDDGATELITWLKSLRPSWKPSEEQMLNLRCVISGCSYDIEPLVSLEEKLEKL